MLCDRRNRPDSFVVCEYMARPSSNAIVHRLSRRSFLSDLGGGTIAVAVLGLAACTSEADPATSDTTAPDTATSTTAGTPSTEGVEEASPGADTAGLQWARVNLGFVSAYVLARGSEYAVVDTGTPGSEGEILSALQTLGGSWGSVNHVIATHAHGDHVGSINAVMGAAAQSTGYAGADDLASIESDRDLVSLLDGDEVFGLQVVASPGHTAGSISVYDADAGLLIAGDAMNVEGGSVTGPNPDFSSDLDAGNMSVQRLAELQFETLLVGHGEPVVGGAGAAVVDLAATLS